MSIVKLPKLVRDRVDQIFERCRDKKSTKNSADFMSTVKVFWSCLNNSLSLVDLAGIWAITVSVGEDDGLDSKVFFDFFNGIARLKYPTAVGNEFCSMLLDDLDSDVTYSERLNMHVFDRVLDRNAIHELFKLDSSLKKAYTTFAGDNIINVDGGLTWEEVRGLSLGMEVEGFLNFADSYAICPSLISPERCTSMARDVLDHFPLSSNSVAVSSAPTSLLYPQFELLVCLTAIEAHQARMSSSVGRPASSGVNMSFARKTVGHETIVSRIVSEFFKGIKFGAPALYDESTRRRRSIDNIRSRSHDADSGDDSDDDGDMDNPATSSSCLDQYSSTLKHSRQAMLFRMQKLFETVEHKLLTENTKAKGPAPALLDFIANSRNEDALFNSKLRFASKPVVISDAIPLPTACCTIAVEQLLSSALAHHNLGSYQETLMFLDAARAQAVDSKKPGDDTGSQKSTELPSELEMYIILSKGNLYRSCGEDEKAMICYMDGWNYAKEQEAADWDIIFVNSIGVLAYYSIRYDISLLCFDRVVRFREQEYGSDSSDTATALNNEGCSLYCMHERSEARLRFERCWLVGSKVLGHRSPRAIVMWRNLEKARRSSVAAENKTLKDEMRERVFMRPDAEKLLIGGAFSIKAVAPPNKAAKGKKKKSGGGKKKKK